MILESPLAKKLLLYLVMNITIFNNDEAKKWQKTLYEDRYSQYDRKGVTNYYPVGKVSGAS